MSEIALNSSGRRSRGRVAVPIVLALVAAMMGLGAAPANAATGSLVITVVSDAGGAPIPNTQVSLNYFDGTSWNYVPGGYTDADGKYLVSNAPLGQYQLYFYGPNSSWAPEAYDNQYDYQKAGVYTLTAGSSSLTVGLSPAASISGTVTQAGGGFPAGGYVQAFAYSADGVDASTSASGPIDSNGHYTVSPLPPGQFVLEVRPPSGSSYVGEYYNNTYSPSAATPIAVTAAQSRTGFDMQIEQGATISGTVTGPGSVPAAGVKVEVWQTSPKYGYFDVVKSAVADAAGAYSIAGLTPGSYSLRFNATGTAWASEWFSGKSDALAATPIVLTAAQVHSATNAQLVAGATISGTITDAVTGLGLAGYADVDRQESDGSWERVGYTAADASGQYAARGLSAGTYRVALEGTGSDYAIEYSGNSFYPDTAEQFVVATGATSGGHSAALVKGVKIQTHAVDQTTHMPVNAVAYLEIERAPGEWVAAPEGYGSGDTGLQNESGLPPGTYRIHWEDRSGVGYVTQWWNDKASAATADLVTLAPGASFTGTAYLSTDPIPAVSPAPTPTITGVPQIGNTLTAHAGTWGPAPVQLTYQWYVHGVAKAGAVASTLVLGASDVGYPVTVAVTGAKGGYLSVTQTSAATAAVVQAFADVPTGASFATEINWMYTSGISTGSLNGSGYRVFKPLDAVTRATAAAFLYRAAGRPAFTPPTTPSFSDVPATGQFYKEIEWMKAQGISTGTANGNGTFSYKPGDVVTRQVMATFLYRAAGSPAFTPPTTPSFTDVPTSNAAYAQIQWMKANGITTGSSNGNGTFSYKPADPVSRGAMAAFLYRSHPHGP